MHVRVHVLAGYTRQAHEALGKLRDGGRLELLTAGGERLEVVGVAASDAEKLVLRASLLRGGGGGKEEAIRGEENCPRP